MRRMPAPKIGAELKFHCLRPTLYVYLPKYILGVAYSYHLLQAVNASENIIREFDGTRVVESLYH